MNYVEPIRDLEDVKRVRENLPTKYGLIWDIGSNVGLRVSDILALNVCDLLDKDEVYVREKKTKKLKIFPIKKELKEKIRDYYENYIDTDDNRTYYGEELYNSCFFEGERGSRLSRNQVYKIFNKVCKELNIKENIGTHTMRKTFGYHHYKQFKDVALLQTIFNHSSPAITLRYIGITQEEINKSYANFSLEQNVEYYQAALANKISDTASYLYKNKILSKNLGDIVREIAILNENILELKSDILGSQKNITRQERQNTKIVKDLYAQKVLENLKNYLANGGGKYSAFCELMLTVD